MDASNVDNKVTGPLPENTEPEAKVEPEGAVDEEELYLQTSLVVTTIVPLTVKAVLELGVFDILAKGCASNDGTQSVMMTAEDIVKQLPTKNPQAAVMLDRMLVLLASFNIIKCDIEEKENIVRRYGPAPVLKWFGTNEDCATIVNMIRFSMDQAFFTSGLHLNQAVLEGGTAFEKAHGMKVYEYIGRDPQISMVFNKAMKDDTSLIVNKILETYQGFKDVQVLVDVGGSVGVSLSMIIAKYPHIKGINLDLPHAIANAPPLPGVNHVAGDMFDCIPHGDAILLKWVIHNWSDEHCVKILKNCYLALPDEGKVIVVEYLLPVTPQATARSQSIFILDVIMLMNYGGKERTKKEFETLAKEAGFTKMEMHYIWKEMWILELTK